MFLGTQRVNARGHLVIGGVDVVSLVKKFGTPLILLDGDCFEGNATAYRRALERAGGGGRIYYASKANCAKFLSKRAYALGLGLDVASLGELETAIAAGVPGQYLVHHGNNKSLAELDRSLAVGTGRIVVDNEDEAKRLLQLKKKWRGTKLWLRITPGIEPATHKFIATGQVDSKFGFSLSRKHLTETIQSLLSAFPVVGIHGHIGSQLLDAEAHQQAAEVMVEWLARLRKWTGAPLTELNLGGGLGIRYTPFDRPVSIDRFVADSVAAVRRAAKKIGLGDLAVSFEPGRSIVGEAGTTIYRVGSIKKIPKGRTYIAIDGGMADNPRVALYEAKYTLLLANRAAEKKKKRYTVAGKCCETGDILGWDILLPQVKVGDLLAILCTGAYTYSMASNYNRLLKPAQVWVQKGKAECVTARESLQHLLALDR